ncbi:MAG: aldehyde ferredoxin oxidoreductase family protein [Candidatus Hadarchaeales archaeon]
MVDERLNAGYAGRILDVNLNYGEIKVKETSKEHVRWIGGAGLATKLVTDLVDPGVDPFSESNVLVFCTGPVTGTIPMSSRYVVASKSPLTGTIGDADSGGFWGPELKGAGFDAIIVRGRSKRPVFIWAADSAAEIRDAGEIWGMDTRRTENEIKKQCGNCKVALIGPAGENLVRFSVILNDGGRVAGRSGLGAVMGSKNLKAIAVKGDFEYSLSDDAKALVTEMTRHLISRDGVKRLSSFGTGAYLEIFLSRGNLPLKNWSQDDWSEDSARRISANRLSEFVNVKMKACRLCPVGCEKRIEYDGVEEKGPEYETIAALGSLCLIDDPMEIVRANSICNLLGVDTIETGTLVAFLMECVERKILSEKTIGVPLSWGNGDRIPDLVEMISFRRGYGNFLAEGVKRVSDLLEPEAASLAMHVKGAPICMHDPRVQQDRGLNYATLPSGAYHGKGGSNYAGLPESRSLAEELVRRQNMAEVIDSLVMCSFAFEIWAGGLPVEFIPRILRCTSNIDLSLSDLDKIGGDIFNMKVSFTKAALGIERIGEKLPERFKVVPRVREGVVHTFDAERYLGEYHMLRGRSRN